ncbi:MAG: undecaprenyldiphospho-muramoylpentapeptide beta-N-acetylglucosaminyltransferase [Clostridia bacterium]|nr:undecaprenyldiphospho-muramoylpentapeptide beta-N-acetylglucosaminyltransferase [Clostridia bacterium]
MKRIILTGGGTAGHVTPNLALIPRLLKDGWDVHYVGEANSVEERLTASIEGVTYHAVSCGKLRRYFDLKNFSDPFRVIKGIAQATSLIRKLKPDVVFSKGGFVSVPVVYGAKLNGVPIVCHESDMTPGLANKLTAPFANVMCCTFPEAAKLAGAKGLYTGTPIRPEILKGNRANGLKRFGFKDGIPVIMITGGSSGAVAINEAVRGALPKLTQCFQVLHLCGPGNFNASLEGTKNYTQCEYLDEEMADAYACADILLSRAGSNTLCEIAALRKPALLVPYPKGASRGDQIINAQSFVDRGLAHQLLQENMTPETLYEHIIKLYASRGELYEAMRTEPAGNGVENVLKEIYKAAKK